MKARVVLVNPPYPPEVSQSIFLPLGIGYLAAVLEKEGYTVDVVDCQTKKYTPQGLEEKFRSLNPDIIGVTSATVTYLPALEVLRVAKAAVPKALTLMGGPHVSVLDQQALAESPDLDIVVRGEGEQTILELARFASEKGLLRGLSTIEGITYRRDNQTFSTPDRRFMQDIDSLPYPAHHHFDTNLYKLFGVNYMPIITSRGCPSACTFCLASKMCGQGFRGRSPKRVVDELEWLRDEFGAGAYAFYDDTFTFDLNRAFAICDEMQKRRVDLPWDCRTRVDRVSRELLAKLKATNCQLIHFGVESGSPEMLKLMRKGTTVELNAQAINWAKEAGISVAVSLVIGYPTETPQMLEQTIDFLYKTKPDYVYMCEAVPYPGTELAYFIKELGLEVDANWNQYREETQIFKNTLLPLERLEEVKKAFFDDYFSYGYFLRKKMKRDFYSQIMARAALNHLVWNNKVLRWGFRKLSKLRAPKKSMGGYSSSAQEQAQS
ncbi:MAG: B12-binding domain-containing radical SAM protein [Nitrososphaerota archaeon]|uniref:B12-binding domain-containing radical SAM protein n=1 Tax=Candidatus Bathycorpusculum sp. TaxID=2994959 RepID=UPI002826EA13|nr:B12-binding domain-containing radical SAM protein [Candidatus Termitimicrobium sp.]MCL2432351.1 B12-binding domain-containing radical SAM protein [Candidatus Termitimicrobium sp.]MDR0492848.1 B12-binding domain-containing radical SAM protein [Nitrososphaerota archaeon]